MNTMSTTEEQTDKQGWTDRQDLPVSGGIRQSRDLEDVARGQLAQRAFGNEFVVHAHD